jgi:YVTN family beta-propeller protein
MKIRKRLIIIALTIIIATPGYILFRKWAREHTNWATAVTDHPTECLSCHLYRIKSGPVAKLINADYITPFNLALTSDGSLLLVAAQEANCLIVKETDGGKEIARIVTGELPHSVVISSDDKTAYVSNQWADLISVIDMDSFSVKGTLRTGNGPAEMALSRDGKYLYAVNSYSNDVSFFDLERNLEVKRIPAGNNPTGISVSPDGKTLYITSRRALLTPYGSPVETEMTVIDAEMQRVAERKIIQSAYMMENVEFTPAGDLVITPLIRPKNLVPSIQVERGWMMTNGIGIIETKPGGKTIQLLFDEPNAYYADPYDIAISPDGRRAYVSNSGVNRITVIDIDSLRALINRSSDEELRIYANHLGMSSHFVARRVTTGANPKGLVLSPEGSLLYVAERLDDRVAVYNTATMEREKEYDLGGPRRLTVARHGQKLLNNAGRTFQNQYSCYTCHPDTHEDGLVYNMASIDMGRNLANTQTLRSIGEIPPYKWNGKNQTIYKQDGMRFSTVLTRTEAFTHKELDALVAYISTGIHNPPNLMYNSNGELTASQKRGKMIFERTHDLYGNEIPVINRCVTCHPAPHFTNMEMTDVGTLAASDDSVLFDAPHLNNIYSSPPYLHDGRAMTLEEIWTIYGQNEMHGALNDLTKIDLNDLIEYLKSLRDPVYEKTNNRILKASMSKK